MVFEYSFPLEVLIDGRYFVLVRPQYAYIYGCAMFISPENAVGPIGVSFDVPPGWAVAVPFEPVAANVYRVNRVSELLHNIVHGGPLAESVTREFDGMTLTYYLFQGRQASHAQMESYIDITHRMLVEMGNAFGDMPMTRLNIIDSLSVQIGNLKNAGWGGWTQVWPGDRYDDLAHHVVHGWIFYEGDSTLQYWGPNFNWFLEGVPTFYQQLISERIDLGPYPVAPGDQYFKYAIIASSLNDEILAATNGQKSLDDLLRLLYGRYRGQPFGEPEMRSAINEVTGTDLTSYFDENLR